MKKKNTNEAEVASPSASAPTSTVPEAAPSAGEATAASASDAAPSAGEDYTARSSEAAPSAGEAIADEAAARPAQSATSTHSTSAAPIAPAPDVVERQEVNRLVAEAEARGYLRGRNEVAEISMNTPGLWENPRRTAMDRESEPDPTCGFLSKIRPGVWD